MRGGKLLSSLLLILCLGWGITACEEPPEEITEPEEIYRQIEIPAVQDPDTIKIMSFNIRVTGDVETDGWLRRKAVIAQTLEDASPDLIGMQEANVGMQLNSVTELLQEEYGVVAYGRDVDNTGESCPIYYRLERFELITSGVFWLSETPFVPSAYEGTNANRICTYAVLSDKNTQKELVYCNTHLSVDSVSAAGFGAGVILNFLAESGYGDGNVIIGGDFNSPDTSDAYQSVASAGFADTRLSAADSVSGCTYHELNGYQTVEEGGTQIDYIFVKGQECVEFYRIFNSKIAADYASDHYAILSAVKF